jgi:hypothetical protein
METREGGKEKKLALLLKRSDVERWEIRQKKRERKIFN